MKSPLKKSIGEVVTDYGARVMKVFKKGLLQRSLFDFYGDVKADKLRVKESSSVPATPIDGDGGVLYTKSADGKLYYKSNEVAEVELSAADTVLTSEQVQDIVGAMVDGGTETNIAVTYDDAGGKLNFVSTDTNTTYSEATSSAEGLMSTAHHDKLDGIETSADVTDTANVTAAGALMDSELTDLAGIKSLDTSTLVNLAGTQTITGEKTFERKLILDADKNITPSGDGVAMHVDAQDITDTNTSSSGTATTFSHVVIENPRLMATNSSVTTTNASTFYVKGAPVASTNQTITNAYSIYVNGGDSYFGGDIIVAGNNIKDDDGTTCITFDSSGNTSIGGTLSCADLDITGAANALTVNPQTGNVAINCISTDADCMVRVQDNSTAGTNVIGMVATGDDLVMRNDEGNFKVKVANNATDALTLDQSSNLTVGGIITGKQREIYSQSFLDDLGTTKHYLPFKDINEQTTIYQEEAAMIVPCDGRVVSVTIRTSSITGSGNMVIGVNTIAPNVNQFSTGNWTEEETESLAVTSSDDYHVFHFAFDNAKHFDSGDLLTISIENDADLSGTTYWYVSTVIEYDWNTYLGTTSAEYDSNP